MKQTFKTFGTVWLFGTACSTVPFGGLGVAFGQPAVLLAALLIAAFFRLEPRANR